MSNRKVTDIMRDVRILMDMNGTDTQLVEIASPDTLSVNEIIKDSIETAAKDVMMAAPARMLGEGATIDSDITWEENHGVLHSGHMVLPSDFMRLIAFRMEGWKSTVTDPIDDASPLYPICKSALSGVTGNPEQPVVAVVTGDDQQQMLEFYSCENGTENAVRKRYLPMPKIKGMSIYGAVPFGGIAAVEKIEQRGLESDYTAIYDTNTRMFVYTNNNSLILNYYSTCPEDALYNDREKNTIRQDTFFTFNSEVYEYDAVEGLKKIADVTDKTVEMINIPELLYDDVIRRCACLAYLTLGDDDGAKRMGGNFNEEKV